MAGAFLDKRKLKAQELVELPASLAKSYLCKLSGEFATDLARSIGCPYAGKVLLRTDQGKEGQTVPSCSFASVELQFHR
ncbi:unnamed protein product [Dracunculus medinensis]|uniref:AIRS_C domain-containing protein n=1 Tax=Dracunculus medinensis TaxID=318479 RepID=A0A0N4U349_DRAME|nr:unnamed protein product [Dracunculus medinensis]